MELVISGLAVAKFMVFLFLSGFSAFIFLFPVNDQPTSLGQKIFFCVAEVFIFCVLFGFITLKFTA